MSIYPIIKHPDERLTTPCEVIPEEAFERLPEGDERGEYAHALGDYIKSLIPCMFETLDAHEGVGLAAPQMGIPARVLIYDLPEKRGALVNPRLFFEEGSEPVEMEESCFSLPDTWGNVLRHRRVLVKGRDQDFLKVEFWAEGRLAQCLQHEVDHLDGKLYIHRMGKVARRMVLQRQRKQRLIKKSNERSRRKRGANA